MDAFIKKQHYNFIRKRLFDLNATFKGCTDKNTIESCKLSTQQEIISLFPELSEKQKALLDISSLEDALDIDTYTQKLNDYIYGMPSVTNAQLSKLFKKEKKLKLPSQEIQDKPHVYLSWIDIAIRKLFIVYPIEDKLLGMACRIPNQDSKSKNICTLCHNIGDDSEVAFVSPICKSSAGEAGTYRSIGFYVCLNHQKCNDRITSTEKLEKLLKDVNQLK